ncbi:MAG: hypothetical protein II852_15715 [Bacteroidales bacterium]|nr:hypothetical protein [Bacteroidales bacterium]
MASKEVKISFHILNICVASNSEEPLEEYPFSTIGQLLEYIRALGDDDKKQKFYDLKDHKFCFLDYVYSSKVDGYSIYEGCFKSARHEFRPSLINKLTGNERENPKDFNEGDVEKTHFVVKIVDDGVFLLWECNVRGVSPQNFVNYLNNFKRKQMIDNNSEERFRIEKTDIVSEDFLTEIKKMSRTSLAEIYFDKRLLGGDALNFSNRTLTVKKDVMLSVKADLKESITNFAIDVWNKLNGSKSSITRIKVKGKDEDDNSVLLDTSFLRKTKSVRVEMDTDTGEIISTDILTSLKFMAKSFA